MSANEKTKPNRVHRAFSRAANIIAWEAGKPAAFVTALSVVIVWAATGPMFRYSDTWQLVINTGTTIVTFLMVFLIQNSQNQSAMDRNISATDKGNFSRHRRCSQFE